MMTGQHYSTDGAFDAHKQCAMRVEYIPGRHHTWCPYHCSSKKENAPGGESEGETGRGRERGGA